MKNSPGGRLRGWRARRCSSHASARQSQPGSACGQTAPGGAAGGKTGAGELSAPDAGDGQTNVRERHASRAAPMPILARRLRSSPGAAFSATGFAE